MGERVESLRPKSSGVEDGDCQIGAIERGVFQVGATQIGTG